MIKFLGCLSLVIFYYSGKGRSLIERILGIDIRLNNQKLERGLDFTFINRLIVWQAVSKSIVSIVLQVMPIFQEARLASFLPMFESITKLTMYQSLADQDFGSKTPVTGCPECNTSKIVMPFKPHQLKQKSQNDTKKNLDICNCTYCYVCLASRDKMAENKCKLCGLKIHK